MCAEFRQAWIRRQIFSLPSNSSRKSSSAPNKFQNQKNLSKSYAVCPSVKTRAIFSANSGHAAAHIFVLHSVSFCDSAAKLFGHGCLPAHSRWRFSSIKLYLNPRFRIGFNMTKFSCRTHYALWCWAAEDECQSSKEWKQNGRTSDQSDAQFSKEAWTNRYYLFVHMRLRVLVWEFSLLRSMFWIAKVSLIIYHQSLFNLSRKIDYLK